MKPFSGFSQNASLEIYIRLSIYHTRVFQLSCKMLLTVLQQLGQLLEVRKHDNTQIL